MDDQVALASPDLPPKEVAYCKAQTSVAISESAQLFREGLKEVLNLPSFEVAVATRTSADILGHLRALPGVDLVIFSLDPAREDEQQFADVARCRSEFPLIRIVVLSSALTRDRQCKAVAVGADAMLSKDISFDVLRQSLALVLLGQQIFSPHRPEAIQLADEMQSAADNPAGLAGLVHEDRIGLELSEIQRQSGVVLSPTEAQILQALINGASNKMIARDLDIPEGRVKGHTKQLFRKAGVKSRTQVAVWGISTSQTLLSSTIPSSAFPCNDFRGPPRFADGPPLKLGSA